MQNENFMSASNALQIFRGPLREPMQQINGDFEDGMDVEPFLRKSGNNEYENLGDKPHNAFMDQLGPGLPLGLAAEDKQMQHGLTPTAGAGDYVKAHQLAAISQYSQKENDCNLGPVFRQCENFNERPEYTYGASQANTKILASRQAMPSPSRPEFN